MTRPGILEFMRSHSLAVQASVSPHGTPQAAVVGFIVTDDFEIIFDTVDTARKVINLRRNAAWGMTYLRVRPRWLRFSDFNHSPPAITELTF